MLTLRIPGTIILGLAAVCLAACGGTTSAGTGAATSASSSALIHTASMKVAGKTETVLKNARGLTLYYFTADTATSIACTGGCASTWPPLLSPSGAPTSSPVLPGTLSVVNGPNGNQVLYNRHPPYTYSKNRASAAAYGPGPLREWLVATPALPARSASATRAQRGGP